MPTPVIVLLSRDQSLINEFPAGLKGQADLRMCDSVDDVQDLVRIIRPSGFVADFRRTTGTGFTEARLLSNLRRRFPGLSVTMLTGDVCPQGLEQTSLEEHITHFKGNIDVATVARTFRQFFPETFAPRPAPTPSAGPTPELQTTASQTISQRFETASAPFRQMLVELEIAARHDVTILLIGETGAGKTYLSRLIHEMSPRRGEPFLPVACGALPNDLIESELFGHVKGAFTSAHADKEGKFLAARRGSLLLDEIDVLGLEQQVKLLRVLETGEFEPVGSNETHKNQSRIIAASNLDLQPLVERGRFRPDLYYRLNMLKFVIPPLRERKIDIVPLARKFVRQFATKHQVPLREIDPGLFDSLLAYPWPGNVRELEHVMQRAVIYCRDGVLRAEHLPGHITGGYAGPTNDPSVNLGGLSTGFSAGPSPLTGNSWTPPSPPGKKLEGRIASTEKDLIEQALFKNSFSRTKTARDLGISRVTLYNKMKRYGIS